MRKISTKIFHKNLEQKILPDERIFFYKDDLVLAHMGANSRRALILSNWFLDGRLFETGA